MTVTTPERYVIEPAPAQVHPHGWQGVLWRGRCPECGWHTQPYLHPLDVGVDEIRHVCIPVACA